MAEHARVFNVERRKEMYSRINNNVFFLFPTIAVGVDTDGRYFFEVAFFNFAVGFGATGK